MPAVILNNNFCFWERERHAVLWLTLLWRITSISKGNTIKNSLMLWILLSSGYMFTDRIPFFWKFLYLSLLTLLWTQYLNALQTSNLKVQTILDYQGCSKNLEEISKLPRPLLAVDPIIPKHPPRPAGLFLSIKRLKNPFPFSLYSNVVTMTADSQREDKKDVTHQGY